MIMIVGDGCVIWKETKAKRSLQELFTAQTANFSLN